jgi:ribosome-associated protein
MAAVSQGERFAIVLAKPMDEPLQLGRGVEIPLSEVELRASRSSGPGGQHANVTASRVEAVFDVEASRSLGDEHKRRIAARLGPVVRAAAQDTRSQTRNRELALQRLRARLASALTVQRPRRPTKPTAAARRKRMDAKRRRSDVKRARRRPEPEG